MNWMRILRYRLGLYREAQRFSHGRPFWQERTVELRAGVREAIRELRAGQ